MSKGTLSLTSILSTIVLFSVSQYVNKSKDANIIGNLAILVSSGEVYYNGQKTYESFCSSNVVTNAISEIPKPSVSPDCSTGLCCEDTADEWAACAQLFSNSYTAYCVDSRGVKRQICNSSCVSGLTQCPSAAGTCD